MQHLKFSVGTLLVFQPNCKLFLPLDKFLRWSKKYQQTKNSQMRRCSALNSTIKIMLNILLFNNVIYDVLMSDNNSQFGPNDEEDAFNP